MNEEIQVGTEIEKLGMFLEGVGSKSAINCFNIWYKYTQELEKKLIETKEDDETD